jgi:phosphatidylinositol alpha-1,6-mannosyltransferase
MPKTLLLTHFFPPAVGGIEEYYRHVAAHLPKDECVVLTQALPETPSADDAHVIRVNFFPGKFPPRWFPWIWRLPQLIRRQRIEQLWIGHISPLTPLAWLTARFMGLRVIVSVHGADLLTQNKHALSGWLALFAVRHADIVLANSEFLAHALRQRGVADERITIIPPGVESFPEISPDERLALRERLGVQKNWVLLTIARLVPRKGIDRLIRAVVRLTVELPTLKLVILGDGPERPALESLVSELGVRDQIEFQGAVEAQGEEKKNWLAAADAFALVTRPTSKGNDIESYGIVYREAQAAGLPVIASRLGGAVEIIEPEKDGFLIPDGDIDQLCQHIIDLAGNPETSRRIGSAGKISAQKNTWEARWPLLDLALNRQRTAPEPLVSVIVPCWNVEDFLVKTLESIAGQTYKNIEIIVVDDGSTDRTREVAAAVPGVHVLAQENRGAPAARNAGARQAKGAFLLFCDADVLLQPHAIARFVQLLELHPDRDFAYSAFRLGWRSFHRLEFDPERLRHHNYINTVSLIRASAFPGFDETLSRYQDWDLWLTVSARGGKGIGTAQYLFHSASRIGISRKHGVAPHADLIERFLRREGAARHSVDPEALERLKKKHNLP